MKEPKEDKTMTKVQEYGLRLIKELEETQSRQYDKEQYTREERRQARLRKEEVQAELITWINCF
jgi:hypothetical protein